MTPLEQDAKEDEAERALEPRATPKGGRQDFPSQAKKASRQGGSMVAIAVAIVLFAIVGLSAWYLSRPAQLIIQGEADSTRIDIAARVDGRISKIAVVRPTSKPVAGKG